MAPTTGVLARVVVGVAGSAEAVAVEIADRLGADLRPIVALRGKDVDLDAALAQRF